MIRMEWSEDAGFEDRATLAVVNRRLPVPEYKVRKTRNALVIRTADLKLTYRHTSGKTAMFDSTNLSVEFRFKGTDSTTVWYPGKDESGNLMGTARTLDGCDGIRLYEPYDNGVLSKDGWAIVDESDRHVLVKNDSDWGEWVQPRSPQKRCDLYLFAYGHDYKAALNDFTKIAGKIPLPPKYAFGYWWSRYWQYSDFEFVDLAKKFRAMDIPIDVMIIDMDWHDTWTDLRKIKSHDEFGQGVGWTGYTWQKQLFPNPSNFLRDLHDLKMKTSLNLHPASGIQPQEECYDRFVKDYIERTQTSGNSYDGPENFIDSNGHPKAVPFRISDQDWTDAYFNSVIHPLEDMGVDFWWLDWVQPGGVQIILGGQPVQVEVGQRLRTPVIIHNGKGGAGDQILAAQPGGQTLGEGGLSGAQSAEVAHKAARRQLFCQPSAQCNGLLPVFGGENCHSSRPPCLF